MRQSDVGRGLREGQKLKVILGRNTDSGLVQKKVVGKSRTRLRTAACLRVFLIKRNEP